MNYSIKWYSQEIVDEHSYCRTLSFNEKNIVKDILTILQNDDFSTKDKLIEKILYEGLNLLFEEITRALIYARGFIILKGLPAYNDLYHIELVKKFFLQFCRHLGSPLKQNKNHDLIFDVKSIEGMTLDTRSSRGPYVKEALPMHTDAGAILGMYCFSSANKGGHTLLSSARVVHDEIQKIRPDLLEVLYQPFYADRRDNEAEGKLPYDQSPVFAMYDDQLRCQYHEPFYTDAQKKFPDIPRFTSLQQEALVLFDQISLQKNIVFETKLEAGSVIFINNEEILHGRTSFDHPNNLENKTVRHLLRIWLNTPKIRHTFPSFLGYLDL